MEIGKKNIEWAKQSVNPITGCNGPDGKRCEYCYAERIARRFKNVHGYPSPDPFVPSYHPHRLEKISKRKKPTIYFFGSMCDWLDDAVKPAWRKECLQVMADNPRHTFITLTKQYKNLWKIAYDSPEPHRAIPPNVWVGITVTDRSQVWGIEELKKVRSPIVRFISFEPLKEDIANIVDLDGIDWIIIGAQSRQNGVEELKPVPAFMPEKTWVQKLAYKPCIGIPDTIPTRFPTTKVFLKPNLGDYVAKGWFSHKLEEMPEPYTEVLC